MALCGAITLQTPLCTDEQIEAQIARGVTAVFNIVALELANQIIDLDP
ncbi:MAG: hypothetical protein ACYTHJ_01065 [Planctomycetota bacterium]|jgi:hypothetical protein